MFSIFHLNIRSVNKNFGNLAKFLCGLKQDFKVFILTETWLKDENANESSLYQIPNYTHMNKIRVLKKVGASPFSIFIHKTLSFRQRNDLNKCTSDIEELTVEASNETKENIIISGI